MTFSADDLDESNARQIERRRPFARFDSDGYALMTPTEISESPIFRRLAIKHNIRLADFRGEIYA